MTLYLRPSVPETERTSDGRFRDPWDFSLVGVPVLVRNPVLFVFVMSAIPKVPL